MAFDLRVEMELEYRGQRAGVSKDGNEWMSLLFEDDDASQVSVSVPREMQRDVLAARLDRGLLYLVAFRAVARADGNSYCQLQRVPDEVE